MGYIYVYFRGLKRALPGVNLSKYIFLNAKKAKYLFSSCKIIKTNCLFMFSQNIGYFYKTMSNKVTSSVDQ